MTQLITKGYTDYFGDVIEVTILSYDNDKYVQIEKSDGTQDEVKRGYIKRNPELTRNIPRVHWFMHGGGKREEFRPRFKRTTYHVKNKEFETKADAMRFASQHAKVINQMVEVTGTREQRGNGGYSWYSGYVVIECYPEGHAVQYGSGRRKRSKYHKFLRGYGKVFHK